MKTQYIFFILIFWTGCMALPKQPSLTEKESEYFNKLSKLYNCKVSRDVNPRAKKVKPDNYEEGWYLISLDNLPCELIGEKNSLKIEGFKIARKLFKEILDNNFEYSYNQISVSFSCQTFPNQYKSVSFDYQLDDLK